MVEASREIAVKEDLKIVRLKGKDIVPYITDLARLRIELFKDYPYLYLGDMKYEAEYLQTYVQCPESVMTLVFDNGKVVGASTAIPLVFESAEFQKPFIDLGIDIRTVFYFGESVLMPEYRGKKIYRQFFHERESAAREYGSQYAAFCAIVRPEDDPRRPEDYVSLDHVWQRFGYERHSELCVYFQWQEIGEAAPSKKSLVMWIKEL
jgi:GNAT superfamily N-acetyltransferase